jgi:hypothetical protein
MKKCAFLMLLLVLLLSLVTTCFAGGGKGVYSQNYSNSLEVAILPVFWANLDARYEYAFNEVLSAFGDLGYAPAGSALLFSNASSNSNLEYSFAHGAAGVCVYPTAPSRGLYFQLSGDYYYFSLKDKYDGSKASYSRYMVPAMMIGWKWVIADRAILRLGGGSGYGSGGNMAAGYETIEWNKIQSRLDFNLGFMF